MGWLRRLRGTFSRAEGDFDEERRFHVDERVDEYVRSGMSTEEARRVALRTFSKTSCSPRTSSWAVGSSSNTKPAPIRTAHNARARAMRCC